MENTLSPIGVLERIENGRLYVRRIDALDGTPLLDIKYVPEFGKQENIRTGWLETAQERVRKHRVDGRFQLAKKGRSTPAAGKTRAQRKHAGIP